MENNTLGRILREYLEYHMFSNQKVCSGLCKLFAFSMYDSV